MEQTTIYEDDRPKWRAVIILGLIAILALAIASIVLVLALRIPERSDLAIRESQAIAPALRADKIDAWGKIYLALVVTVWALPAAAWAFVAGRVVRLIKAAREPQIRVLERPIYPRRIGSYPNSQIQQFEPIHKKEHAND